MNMSKIYLDATNYGSIVREPYSSDSWDRGDTVTYWEFHDAYTDKVDSLPYYHLSHTAKFDIFAGDTVFLVVIVYSTGDSFGHDDGACSEIMYVSKDKKDAEYVCSLIEENRYVDDGTSKKYEELIDKLFEDRNVAYLPWMGYFEHLDSVEVLERVMK